VQLAEALSCVNNTGEEHSPIMIRLFQLHLSPELEQNHGKRKGWEGFFFWWQRKLLSKKKKRKNAEFDYNNA
jgi:hypothetical protein